MPPCIAQGGFPALRLEAMSMLRKMEAFATIFRKLWGWSEYAANWLRGWQLTVSCSDGDSDRKNDKVTSHRPAPPLDAREPNGTRVKSAGEGGLMVYPEGSGPPL